MSAPRDILTNTDFCRELDALVMTHNKGQACGMVLILADKDEQAMVCNVKEQEAVKAMLTSALQDVLAGKKGDMQISLKRKTQ